MTAARRIGSGRWGPTVIAAVAVALGVVLRWWHLGRASLWFDEGYTAWVVSLSPGKIVAAIRVDTAPPLYYLLLRAWVAVAGTGEAAMRAPSAACATAAVFLMAAVARRLFADPWARAVAIAAVACSFMQVAYAHEVRFYAAMGLAGAVDLYLALRCCDQRRAAWPWLVTAAGAWAVSLWLNNVMGIYLACLGVAWLAAPGERPLAGRARDLFVVAAAAGAAYAAWVPSMVAQARAVAANFWTRPPTGSDLTDAARWVSGVNEAGSAVGGGAVLVLVAAAVAVSARRQPRAVAVLAAYGLLPVVAAFAYSRWRTSIFMDRAFIVSSAVVPLLAAVPVEAAARAGRLRAAAGGLAAAWLAVAARSAVADVYRVPSHVEDWRAACRCAADAHGDLTVFNANEGELLFDYYARGGDFAPRADLTGTPADFFAARPPRTLARVRSDADLSGLRRALDARPGAAVVFVSAHAPYADPDGRTLALLRSRLRQADCQPFDAVTVYRFVPRTRLGR